MSFFTGKKLLLLGLIVSLLAAVPLTVFFLQQRTKPDAGAAPATTLSFTPPSTQNSPIQKKVDEPFSVDVNVDPGANKNQVSFISLIVTYDATKLATSSAGSPCQDAVCPNAVKFPAVLEGPTYGNGTITITLSVGADPTSVVQTPEKVATITFKGLTTTGTTPTQIGFGTQTQVLSIAESDLPSENVLVLSSSTPSFVALSPSTATPAPTSTTNAPACESLNIDRTTSGTAPFSITFTVNGTDGNGTIQKATFDFGDGPVVDETTGGGIGTKTVSLQKAHTYNNAGTYKATVKLTDDTNAVSNPTTSCEQTITVTGGTGQPSVGTPSATPLPTDIPTDTPTPIPTDTPIPTLPPPGPTDALFGIGAVGIILTIIGAALFFAL